MIFRFSRPLAAAALGALALAAWPAQAQFQALSQDARAAVPSPVRLAQGDAYTASPSRETALFGNPAHLSYLGLGLPKVNLALVGGLGGNVRETWDFYRDTLEPAIEEGLDEIRRTDPDRLERIYNEALRIGGSQKTLAGGAELSGTFTIAGVGVGAGVAGTTSTRARMFNGGAGVPFLDLYTQADVLVPVAASYRLDGPMLAALAAVPGAPSSVAFGAQGTFVRRYVTAKAGPVDTFDPDGEKLYVLAGSGMLVDLGLQAADVGVDGLDLGLTLHNAFGSPIGLTFHRSVALVGDENAPDDAAEIAATEARFADRGAGSAVRAGLAYRLPLPPTPGLGAAARVMLDYTSASTSEFEQSFQAGLRLGAEVSVMRMLQLRTGISQGMPSFGIGIAPPGVRLDYATHGVEDGALLGQSRRRAHLIQARFGIH